MVKIAPSILNSDMLNLAREIKRAERAGADLFHLDIMDGHFVPNISFGPQVVKAIRKTTKLPLESHLMIEDPERYIKDFVDAGSNLIILHRETIVDPDEIIDRVREHGVKVGFSINPDTGLDSIVDYLAKIDLVLLMTVFPGFGGQKFIEDVLPKIRKLAEYRKKEGLNIEIEVDGGINDLTGKKAVDAGATILVAGAYLYRSSNLDEALKKLKSQ